MAGREDKAWPFATGSRICEIVMGYYQKGSLIKTFEGVPPKHHKS